MVVRHVPFFKWKSGKESLIPIKCADISGRVHSSICKHTKALLGVPDSCEK